MRILATTKHGLNVHGVIFDELHAQPNRDHVPYDVWEAQGHIRTTPGNVVDYRWIILIFSYDIHLKGIISYIRL